MVVPTPQGIGVFDLPAGLLLVAGDTDASNRVRHALGAGKLPQEWPKELESVRLVFEGKTEEAAALLAESKDPIDRYNLFVLNPGALERSEIVEALGEDWKPLVDYVAFMVNLTSIPPAPTSNVAEVQALAHTGQAAAWLDDGRRDKATEELFAAVDALGAGQTALRGIILSELAVYTNDVNLAREAATLLEDTDLVEARAQALYHLAGLVHGRAIEGKEPLEGAISAYTQALRGLNETEHRALFARIHLNLGTALLAAPLASASDNMRAAIAIQSLRSAERLLTNETEPEEYQSAKLNLANALVYAPSQTRRDNLVEAVDIYEQLLQMRAVQDDPQGRARVLANQGNVLGHLGFQGDAAERLTEAAGLFEAGGDIQAATLVQQMLNDVQTAPTWAGGEASE